MESSNTSSPMDLSRKRKALVDLFCDQFARRAAFVREYVNGTDVVDVCVKPYGAERYTEGRQGWFATASVVREGAAEPYAVGVSIDIKDEHFPCSDEEAQEIAAEMTEAFREVAAGLADGRGLLSEEQCEQAQAELEKDTGEE